MAPHTRSQRVAEVIRGVLAASTGGALEDHPDAGSPPTREGQCNVCRAPLEQQYVYHYWIPTAHEECAERVAQEEAEASAERDRLARVEQLLKGLTIPRQYREARVADFDPTALGRADAKTKRLLAKKKALAVDFVERWPIRFKDLAFPRVVLMQGGPGTGKTFLAYAIAKAVLTRYLAQPIVGTLRDIVIDIREPWTDGAGGPTERARLRRYRECDLLVIDEASLHAFYGTPVQALYDLVAPREADLMPTIITTNHRGDEFEAMVGPALASRAAGAGADDTVWEFGDVDYRVARAELLAASLRAGQGGAR